LKFFCYQNPLAEFGPASESNWLNNTLKAAALPTVQPLPLKRLATLIVPSAYAGTLAGSEKKS
jgi:hypothetical protein